MSILPRLRTPSPEQVVRDHAGLVYAQLRRIFGPQADVEDVFQMVFVEVLRSLPTFMGRARLSTWIRRITLNVAYQEMRLQYRDACVTSLDESRLPASGEHGESAAVRRESMRMLYAGLLTLEPKQRMAVVLHDVEGCTLREISKLLGRPLQTVASQLHTGRARLAAWMHGGAPARRGIDEEARSS